MVADHLTLTEDWLASWLAWLDVALHREILRLRARYELSMDELRGLYVSDEQVDHLVRRTVPDPDDWTRLCRLDDEREALLRRAREIPSPLRDLAEEFALGDADVLSIVACLAPETDLSYQTLYAYLNDDVARRLPTVDLCARLGAPLEPIDRAVTAGLVEVHRVESAPLWRSAGLTLAEPVRSFLLDPAPRPVVRLDRASVVVLETRSAEAATTMAASVAAGGELVRVDALPGESQDRLRTAVLTARLRGATLLATVEDLRPVGAGVGSAELCRLLGESPVRSVVAVGPGEARDLSFPGADVERLLLDRPAAEARPVSPLDGVAEWVPGGFRRDDLVLPQGTFQRVTELAGAVRHRRQVFESWDFGRLSGGRSSVRALFSGPSGTGKTMSASVLAGELGLELYRIDLSAVVSKYVGETEKNIDRVLSAAEQTDAVLLFDEADALFGKRTEVKDAHDRYANIETSFLLQRLDSFDGVVVLATNLSANLDDAFSRRIHFHIEFPMPDQALRADLWRKALPAAAPVADDVDPEYLAGMFPMSGGDIRSAALMAAFLAAGESRPIGMTHLVKALARQRRQQGKVPSFSEFGDYLRVARTEES